jgi:hypothetical protein
MSDATTPATSFVPAPPSNNSSVMGTKTPSVISFAIGILLFLLPFIDVKCKGDSLKKISGVQLATGYTIDMGTEDSFFGKLEKNLDDGKKTSTKGEKQDPNPYALAALVLGAAGLLLSLVRIKAGATGAFITGILSAAGLIAMYIDINRQMKSSIKPDVLGPPDMDSGFDKQMADMTGITVDFTPVFYLTILAFAAAAFFSYRRMKSK